MTQKLGDIFSHKPDSREFPPSDQFVLSDCFVGVEVEIENVDVGRGTMTLKEHKYGNLWESVQEGSIQRGTELRFSYPLSGANLSNALTVLPFFNDNTGKRGKFTDRTSTHIHLDVREFDGQTFKNFIMLSMIFEWLLFSVCDKNRKASNYCVPLYDRPESVKLLPKMAKDIGHAKYMIQHSQKYTSINFLSIHHRGSVEFRMFNGTFDPDKISMWINILMCIKKYAMEAGDTDIPRLISLKGAEGFINDVFGKDMSAVLLRVGVGAARTSLYKGARRVEQLCERKTLGSTIRTNADFCKKSKSKPLVTFDAFVKKEGKKPTVKKSQTRKKRKNQQADGEPVPQTGSTVHNPNINWAEHHRAFVESLDGQQQNSPQWFAADGRGRVVDIEATPPDNPSATEIREMPNDETNNES